MARRKWPKIGKDYPKDIGDHILCLCDDLRRVNDAVEISLSRTGLPHMLESKISTGITNGIAEAGSLGCSPKWSDVDRSIFTRAILKNITREAVAEARNQIPLFLFRKFHESCNEVRDKFFAQTPLAATDAATQTVPVIGVIETPKVANTATVMAKVPGNPLTAHHAEGVKDVDPEESRDDSSKEEDNESERGEEATDGHELGASHNEEGESDSRDDDSRNNSSGGEEEEEEEEEEENDGNSGSDVGCGNDEDQDTVKEVTVRRAPSHTSGLSMTTILEIKDQASVNRMEGMEPSKLLESISCSLEDHLSEKQLSSAGLHISAASLLPSGDVTIAVSTETPDALSRLRDLDGWTRSFEKTLIGSLAPSYKVIMYSVNVKSMEFWSRRAKSVLINKLVSENYTASSLNDDKPIIRDIRWSHNTLPKVLATLIVEFLNPKHATQALLRGLLWQGRSHGCDRPDKKLIRCARCQGYGHLDKGCSASYRCGKCAGHHHTRTCEAIIRKCASCGGGHYAGNSRCPFKDKERRRLAFTNESTSQITEPTAEADRAPPPSDVRHSTSAGRNPIDASIPSPISLDAESAKDDHESECKPSLPQADPAQDLSRELATLRQEFEDIKKRFIALGTILQSNVSAGSSKRQASEAFADGAEAESSSNVAAKRVKREEESTRGDSMGLYRQPSLYSETRRE